MKVFLVLALVFYYGDAKVEDPKELSKLTLARIHQECFGVSGVNRSLVERARNGDFVDDPQLKEQLFCVFKKLTYQNGFGNVVNDQLFVAVNNLIKNPAKTQILVEKCSVKKDTPQQTAFNTAKCIHEETHKSLF